MIRKKFAVIGLGRFGMKLVEELSNMNREVIAIDSDSQRVEKVRNIASESLILDSTDRESLEKSGVRDVDCVIVAIGKEMETSILTTTLLKEMGIKEIISRADNSLHARILRRVGASRVIFPEEDMGVRLAHSIHFPGVQEYVDLTGPWDLAEFKVSKKSKLVGKKLSRARKDFDEEVNILIVEREKEKVLETSMAGEVKARESIIPKDDYLIQEGDILILFGRPETLEKFIAATE